MKSPFKHNFWYSNLIALTILVSNNNNEKNVHTFSLLRLEWNDFVLLYLSITKKKINKGFGKFYTSKFNMKNKLCKYG